MKRTGLHNNFRMAIFLLLMFGFLRAFFTYCITCSTYLAGPELNEKLQVHFVAAFVYCICGFAIASLFLSVERCFAIYKPKIYERKSDNILIPLIIFMTTVLITVILGFLANENGDNQIPLITVCTAAGFISLIASIAVRKRAMNLWQNRNSSLGQRFQVAEMNRTSPIYLFISVNESLSITAMSVIGFLMLDQDNANAIASDDFLVHLVDLLGAWRIVFINLTIIYYCFVEKKNRLSVRTHFTKSHVDSTADHFTGLKDMWK